MGVCAGLLMCFVDELVEFVLILGWYGAFCLGFALLVYYC